MIQFPEFVAPEDIPSLRALLNLASSIIYATLKEGTCVSANNAEKAAWKKFVRTLGYKGHEADQLARFLYDINAFLRLWYVCISVRMRS